MARPRKRTVTSRQSAALSATATERKRRDSKELEERAQEIPDSGPSEGKHNEDSDIEMDDRFKVKPKGINRVLQGRGI